jgi:hypothetical protein
MPGNLINPRNERENEDDKKVGNNLTLNNIQLKDSHNGHIS